MNGRLVHVVLRAICHLVAEVPLFVIAALQIARGWVPTSDDAVIAWRTWSVFSGPLPLDGQFTQISAAAHHPAFDLGPLQYYLLAVPDRIDPVHGILWGSALVMAAFAALAIEAAWSAASTAAGVVTAAALAVMTATLVESSVNLAWNPSLGAYAFAATVVPAIAVAKGRFGWLPVAVGTGSVAVQSHVSFVLPSLAALVVGLVLGILEVRRLPLRALSVAGAVGLACFLAPLVQEITGHPGNWSVVAGNIGHFGKTVGLGAGFRGVGAATSIPPSWWVHVPPYSSISAYGVFDHRLYASSESWGIAAIVLSAGLGLAAWICHRRTIAALGLTSAGCGLAAAVTLGAVPDSQAPYLVYYLYFCLWPIGMGILVTFGAAIVSLVGAVVRPRLAAKADERGRTFTSAATATTAALAAAVAIAGAGLCVNDAQYGSSPLFLMGWQPIETVDHMLPSVLSVVRRDDPGHGSRRFVVRVDTPIPFVDTALEQSIAYELVVRGDDARVDGSADRPLGAGFRGAKGDPLLVVVPGFHGTFTLRWIGPRSRARAG
jgi:hypothetical protein